MVIDFIEGRDLMTLLRERSEPFLFHETHFILKNILEGIDYIHKE
jgi:serine/threonine protein kinase